MTFSTGALRGRLTQTEDGHLGTGVKGGGDPDYMIDRARHEWVESTEGTI